MVNCWDAIKQHQATRAKSEIIDNTSRPNTTTAGDNAVIITETGRPCLN